MRCCTQCDVKLHHSPLTNEMCDVKLHHSLLTNEIDTLFSIPQAATARLPAVKDQFEKQKKRFEQLRHDLDVKLKLLDENRVYLSIYLSISTDLSNINSHMKYYHPPSCIHSIIL